MVIKGGLAEIGMYMPNVMTFGIPSGEMHVAKTTLVGGPTCRARTE